MNKPAAIILALLILAPFLAAATSPAMAATESAVWYVETTDTVSVNNVTISVTGPPNNLALGQQTIEYIVHIENLTDSQSINIYNEGVLDATLNNSQKVWSYPCAFYRPIGEIQEVEWILSEPGVGDVKMLTHFHEISAGPRLADRPGYRDEYDRLENETDYFRERTEALYTMYNQSGIFNASAMEIEPLTALLFVVGVLGYCTIMLSFGLAVKKRAPDVGNSPALGRLLVWGMGIWPPLIYVFYKFAPLGDLYWKYYKRHQSWLEYGQFIGAPEPYFSFPYNYLVSGMFMMGVLVMTAVFGYKFAMWGYRIGGSERRARYVVERDYGYDGERALMVDDESTFEGFAVFRQGGIEEWIETDTKNMSVLQLVKLCLNLVPAGQFVPVPLSGGDGAIPVVGRRNKKPVMVTGGFKKVTVGRKEDGTYFGDKRVLEIIERRALRAKRAETSEKIDKGKGGKEKKRLRGLGLLPNKPHYGPIQRGETRVVFRALILSYRDIQEMMWIDKASRFYRQQEKEAEKFWLESMSGQSFNQQFAAYAKAVMLVVGQLNPGRSFDPDARRKAETLQKMQKDLGDRATMLLTTPTMEEGHGAWSAEH